MHMPPQEEKLQKRVEHEQQERDIESWRKSEAGRRQGRQQAVERLKVRWGWVTGGGGLLGCRF